MSEFDRTYDHEQMTWNYHDKEFFKENVDVVYKKVAEVVLAQNERFFKEIEKHERRICTAEEDIADHEVRLRKIEKHLFFEKVKKVSPYVIGGVLMLLIMFHFVVRWTL